MAGALTSTTDLFISTNCRSTLQALYVAEAGISHGTRLLSRGTANGLSDELTGDGGILCNSVAFGGGTYTVTVMDNHDDDDQSTDIDNTVILTSTSQKDGATKKIEVVASCAYCPTHALITTGNLTISGNPTFAGSRGGVHSNADLSLAGNPNIAADATASGTAAVTGNPTVGGGTLSGAAAEFLPAVDPAQFRSYADYELRPDGKIYDKNNLQQPLVGGKWHGWQYDAGRSTWIQTENTTAMNGTFYVTGNVEIAGDTSGPGGTQWRATVIATGDIDVSGSPNIATNPDNPPQTRNLALVAGQDIRIRGHASQHWEGIIAAHEQVEISGNPDLEGCVLAEDAASTSDLATSNCVSGDIHITCNGKDSPFVANKTRILSWREIDE